MNVSIAFTFSRLEFIRAGKNSSLKFELLCSRESRLSFPEGGQRAKGFLLSSNEENLLTLGLTANADGSFCLIPHDIALARLQYVCL
jgi:hypothetical protein